MPYRFNSLLPFVSAMPTPANVPLRDIGAARRDQQQIDEAERSNRMREAQQAFELSENRRSNLAGETATAAALAEQKRSSMTGEGAKQADARAKALGVIAELLRQERRAQAQGVADAYGIMLPPDTSAMASPAATGPTPSLDDDPGVQQQYRGLGPSDMVISPHEAGLDVASSATAPADGTAPFDVPGNLGVTGNVPKVPPTPLPLHRMLGAKPDMAITMEEAGITEPSQSAKVPPADPGGLSEFLASQARTDLGYQPDVAPEPSRAAPLPMRAGGIPIARPANSFQAPAGMGTEGNQNEDAAVTETFEAFVTGEREPNVELAQQIAAQVPGLMKVARASGASALDVYKQLKDEYLRRSAQMSAERRAATVGQSREAGLGFRARGMALNEDKFLRQLKRDALMSGWIKYGVGKSQDALKQAEEAMSLLQQATTTPTRDGDALAGRVALMSLVKSLAGARFSDTDLKTVMSAGGKEQTLEAWFNEWTQGGQITDQMLGMLKNVTKERHRMARKQMALAAKKVGENVRANNQIRQYAGGDLDSIVDELEAQTLAGVLPEENEPPVLEEPEL